MQRKTRWLVALLSLSFYWSVTQVRADDRPYDFYHFGPYRANVPRPSAVLGYEVGKTHTTFRDQERVLQAIAAAARDRVRLIDYGTSVEGRPLRLAVVSAPENIAKLEAVRGQIGKLADPRTLKDEAETTRILSSTPCVTWISHCIHGNESASFETAMWTLYTLAASQSSEVEDALRRSVVILNPVFNPDGHERFTVYYNSVALGSPEPFAFEKNEPWAVFGRFNHYRFDMNRDKLAMSQPETRQESRAFLQWHPQVFVDQHGQPETYFFPPNSQPENRHVDRARLDRWTDLFGRANAAAFDKYGWQYVTRETFDLFYPGYLDSWTTLAGAVGMTYETDGGGNLARKRSDETISTLRDACAHHFEAALATITAAAKGREQLLRDYLAFRRDAIESGKTEKMKRVVILPGADPGRAAELVALLARSGVEVRETSAELKSEKAHAYGPAPTGATPPQTTKAFPPGSLVVDLAQPHGRVARAFMEPDADFDPSFVKDQVGRRERNEKKNDRERKEDYDFYDTTAWSLPYAYGLEAYWTEDAEPVAGKILSLSDKDALILSTRTGGLQGGRATFAYLFRYDRDAAAVLALRLLEEDFKLAAATKPVKAGGREWPRGTLVVRVSRNPEAIHKRIEELSREMGVEVFAVNSGYSDESPVGLGSSSVMSLKRPKIAVAAGDGVGATGFGSVWYLLERFAGVGFTALPLRSIRAETLEKFNVLILPDGFGYGSLGKAGTDALKAWVERGNVVIGLEGGGTWFTDKESGISSAVPVGRDADTPKPDAKSDAKPDAKPDDKPKKPTSLPGAIFRAKVDSTHFLGFGYENGEIAVPLADSTFLKPSKQGANVVTFGKGPLKLSGFVWPGNTEELLADTAYVIDEPLGGGHALLFLSDPTQRALWAGLRRMFLSGILFGPGM